MRIRSIRKEWKPQKRLSKNLQATLKAQLVISSLRLTVLQVRYQNHLAVCLHLPQIRTFTITDLKSMKNNLKILTSHLNRVNPFTVKTVGKLNTMKNKLPTWTKPLKNTRKITMKPKMMKLSMLKQVAKSSSLLRKLMSISNLLKHLKSVVSIIRCLKSCPECRRMKECHLLNTGIVLMTHSLQHSLITGRNTMTHFKTWVKPCIVMKLIQL